ncbi:hypothetical protein QTP88_022995 [Uroleucon formosanum]
MNQKAPSSAAKKKKKLQQTQCLLKTNTKIKNYFECNQHVKCFTQKYLTVLIILIIINVFCINVNNEDNQDKIISGKSTESCTIEMQSTSIQDVSDEDNQEKIIAGKSTESSTIEMHSTSTQVLQSVDINIQTSCGLLEQAIGSLLELRQNYNDIVNIANNLCSKWGISSKFPSKHQQFTKLHFDEIDGDRRLNMTEENFRIKIFYPVVDTSLAQLKNRFKGLRTIASTFEFLNPTFLRSTEENDLIKCSFDFIQLYKSDVTSDFTRQLLSIQSIIQNKLDIRNVNDVLIFIVNNDLSTAFCDVLTACIIFLTIPVTVASVERSFSKLKLIKNYLRSSTSQERLSNILVLSIERGRTDEINIEKIITDFANAKARKKMFF